MAKLVIGLVPSEGLQLGCFQEMRHLAEVLCKHVTVFARIRQTLEVGNTMRVEDTFDVVEERINIPQIHFQLINKHTQRTVNINLERIVDVLFHGEWEGVVFDDAKWLFGSKQSIGSREGLDKVGILHRLVNI